MEVYEEDEEVSFSGVSFSTRGKEITQTRSPLKNISNQVEPLSPGEEDESARDNATTLERKKIIQKNQDIISIHKQGRRSTGSLEDESTTPSIDQSTRITCLEKKLTLTREKLFEAEEHSAKLQTAVLHWQEVASQHVPSHDATVSGARALEKLRKQQDRLEHLVEHLVKFVDAETILEASTADSNATCSARAREFRKSLDMMATLPEDVEDAAPSSERDAVQEACKELALVARLKHEAVDRENLVELLHDKLAHATDREKVAKTRLSEVAAENEELNKLTGEMQSAHARLLTMFQTMAAQKAADKSESEQSETERSAVAAQLAALEQARKDIKALEDSKADLEEEAETMAKELENALDEIARLEVALDSSHVSGGSHLENELQHAREISASLGGTIEELRSASADKDRRIEKLEALVSERDARAVELERMLSEGEELIQEFKGAVIDFEGRLKELEEAAAASESIAGEAKRELEAMSVKSEVLSRRAQMSEERALSAEETLKACDTCIQELKGSLVGQEERIEELEGTVVAAEERIEDLENLVSASEDRVDELEGLLEEAKGQRGGAPAGEESGGNGHNEVAGLREELKSVMSDLEAAVGRERLLKNSLRAVASQSTMEVFTGHGATHVAAVNEAGGRAAVAVERRGARLQAYVAALAALMAAMILSLLTGSTGGHRAPLLL